FLTSLIWVPIGVGVGLNPRLARIAQPVIQIAVAFPSNMFFPIFIVVFYKLGIDLSYGSVLLLAIGSQWYILFNVIAGAMNISSDLREAEKMLGLRGAIRWKRLIIPAILPFWVTGGITAAGGAWNASIVAEIVSYGDIGMSAPGLGSYMTEATVSGNWSGIIVSIVVMCLYVVTFNRLVWHRLYVYAEEKCKME
ncbi:MAG: ABC transporter permease subunit, partial [Deltaproteobacteria bacterium]|nr:ABC transporter permease subunit [Deltaproteobacteria bacterium]